MYSSSLIKYLALPPHSTKDRSSLRAVTRPQPHSNRRSSHDWTPFEKRILLCLIAREVHIIGDSGPNTFVRKLTAKEASQSFLKTGIIHKDFPDAFNRALNGGNEAEDIDSGEVIRMALAMIKEKRAAICLLARRQGAPRLTRSKRRVWDRGINFDGDYPEWLDEGRAETVYTEIAHRGNGKEKSLIRNECDNWIIEDPNPPSADCCCIKGHGRAWNESVEHVVHAEDSINHDELPESAVHSVSKKLVPGIANESAEMTPADHWGDLDSTIEDDFQGHHWEGHTAMVETSSDKVGHLEHEATLFKRHEIPEVAMTKEIGNNTAGDHTLELPFNRPEMLQICHAT